MRDLSNARGNGAPVSARTGEPGVATGLCGAEADLQFANPAFHRLAQERSGIALDARGRITAWNPRQTPSLRSVIATVCAAETSGEDTTAWISLERPFGERPLLVVVEPISGVRQPAGPSRRQALLRLADAGRNTLSTAALEALGRLTGAELEVCGLLLRGCSTRDIAECRKVSPETVRQQIKSAMSKLHCHARSDLFRLAASGCQAYAPMGPADPQAGDLEPPSETPGGAPRLASPPSLRARGPGGKPDRLRTAYSRSSH